MRKRVVRRALPRNDSETPARLESLQRLRQRIQSELESGTRVILVDEATFSPKSYTTTVWQPPGTSFTTEPRLHDQRCVACIGAVELTLGKILLTQTPKAAT